MELIIGLFIVVTSIIIGIADQDGFRIRTRPYMSTEQRRGNVRRRLRPDPEKNAKGTL